MPDLSPLPSLAPAPAATVDLGRLADARRAGRARLRRRTATATAGACAIAGVAMLVPNGTGRTASLVPTAPGAPAAATGGADDAVRDVTLRTRIEPAAGGTGAPVPAPARSNRYAAPGTAPQPRDADGADHAVPPPPAPTLPPPLDDPPPAATPVDSDSTITVVANDGSACHAPTSRPWCVRTRGAGTVPAGTWTSSDFEMCFTGSGTGQLHFEDGAHVELALSPQGGNELWRLSSSAAAGHYDVPAGSCARWTVRWAAIRDDGTALAAGSYHLTWATSGGWEHDALPDPAHGLQTLNRRYEHSADLTVS